MFSIDFTHRGAAHHLPAGGHYAVPKADGFRDTPATELRSIIAEIETGLPWREVVKSRYAATNTWLYRIITDRRRTAFFGSVLPAGHGHVLDLGAGWGQVSLPLAASRPVVALEPVAERLDFIRAAARQDKVDGKLIYLEADYFDLNLESRFEAICAIGVLEWAGAFQATEDPQDRQRAFLRKARSELAQGGSLILGIENRLGLKYLLGCPDDHLGIPGIAFLPAALARRRWRETSGHAHPLQSFTYSLSELDQLLREAEFNNVEFFAAYPDYKLPDEIVSLADGGTALNALRLRQPAPLEHNGYNGDALDVTFQENLNAHYQTLAAEKIAHHFAPSFFVRAR